MNSFSRISPDDARTLLQTQAVSIVDIRDAQSYHMGRIKNARHLDNSSVQEFIQHVPAEQPVLVCCYHGHTSQSAAQWLSQQGFTQVYSLDGGYARWQQVWPQECESGTS